MSALSNGDKDNAHRILTGLESREDLEWVAFILAASLASGPKVDWEGAINLAFESEVEASLREEFGED